MQLSDIFLKLGEDSFGVLVRGISMGKLRAFERYDSFKAGARLGKLNTESVRKAVPRFWVRLGEGDEEFAENLAQAILLSQLDLIQAVLGFLEIPNEDGFFAKDVDASAHLTQGWQQRCHEKFKGAFAEAAFLLYINHLAWELDKKAEIFMPVA